MMKIRLSRYRVTYTPTGGEEARVLLSPQDMCNTEPSLEGGPETQKDALLCSLWAAHHSRGNASARLRFDCFTPAISQAHAQAAGLSMWRWLCEHPQGTILLETAFVGLVSAPLIRWEMPATLNSANYTELDKDSTPFEEDNGLLMSYDFTVSSPTDAD